MAIPFRDKIVFTLIFIITIHFIAFCQSDVVDIKCKQGIYIVLKSDSTTVFVDSINYGTKNKGDNFVIKIKDLKGEYKVIGSKPNCFNDYENADVDSNYIYHVSLKCSKFRFSISPHITGYFINNDLLPCISLNVGFRNLNNYWGLQYASDVNVELLHNFSFEYKYLGLGTRGFVLAPALSFGGIKYLKKTRKTTWNQEIIVKKWVSFPSISPRIYVNLIFDHVLFFFSVANWFGEEFILSSEVGVIVEW